MGKIYTFLGIKTTKKKRELMDCYSGLQESPIFTSVTSSCIISALQPKIDPML